jgi:hypothetical protein
MKRWSLGLVALLLATFSMGAPAQAGAPVKDTTTSGNLAVVTLRVEGATSTIFEFPVLTYGHDVTTASGGTHHCDGTNNGANPAAGPTATSALDNGAQLGGFSWDGTWYPSFDDYFVTRVAGESQTATQFWGLLVNGQYTLVGGCQQRVHNGDEVLWAFDSFSKTYALKLTGPASAHIGQSATYHVIDTFTGNPVAGASVNGVLTDASGNATLTFNNLGLVSVKADRADAIRSNRVLTAVIS